jgi:acetyl-CoA carboxylase biotin carboxyl carrier protein
MDLKQIQDLVKMVNKSNISELSIEEKEFKITIKQKEDKYISGTPIQVPQMINIAPPVQTQIQGSAEESGSSSGTAPKETSNLITIKSPMIGTFYRRPSPDKLNFIEEGDEVREGKVVCIIEAMKLFNEIESEVAGKVVKILVQDSMPVEYDQPLFMVEPF